MGQVLPSIRKKVLALARTKDPDGEFGVTISQVADWMDLDIEQADELLGNLMREGWLSRVKDAGVFKFSVVEQPDPKKRARTKKVARKKTSKKAARKGARKVKKGGPDPDDVARSISEIKPVKGREVKRKGRPVAKAVTFATQVPVGLVDKVDSLITDIGLYTNRAELVRAAIRLLLKEEGVL